MILSAPETRRISPRIILKSRREKLPDKNFRRNRLPGREGERKRGINLRGNGDRSGPSGGEPEAPAVGARCSQDATRGRGRRGGGGGGEGPSCAGRTAKDSCGNFRGREMEAGEE